MIKSTAVSIFLLLSISFFVIISYALQHSRTASESRSQDTAGWKTYTNSKWNYRFRYPVSWNVEESTELVTMIRSWKREPGQYSDPSRDIEIIVYPNRGEWPNFEKDIQQGRTLKKGKVTVGGVEGDELIELAERGFSYRTIRIENGQKLYTISIDQKNPEMSVFNQIMGSFEFVPMTNGD